METHPPCASFYLPKDLLHDLSIPEDTSFPEFKDDKHFETECDSSLIIKHPNVKRSISQQVLNTSEYFDETTIPQKKYASVGFQTTNDPYIPHHPFNQLTFEEIFQDPNYHQIFLSMITNRNGSQYLQKKLLTASPREIDLILIALIKQSNLLKSFLCDNYANYFLQQLISQSLPHQRIMLLTSIKEHFYDIARDISGTHCIQKVVEKVNEPEEEEIIKQCLMECSNLFLFCTESNATHIIYRLVDGKKLKQRKYLFTFLRQNLPELSKTVNGSSIIKKLFMEVTSAKMIKKIIKIIETHFFDLSQNQFGNYIIQEALEHFGFQTCHGLIINLIKHSFNFSLQKYASNVIDKVAIILRSNNECMLFNQLINILILDNNNLTKLLQNKFGTFVVYNILSLLSFQEKNFIYQYCNLNTIFSNV
jgi:hypothetical protein